MFMSRLTLKRPEAVRRGVYDAHRALWRLFADAPDRRRDFLFRELDDLTFLAVSHREPRDTDGIWRLELKPYEPRLAAGDRLHFSLRANAVRKTRDEEGRQVRHDVVQDVRTKFEAQGREPPPRLALAQEAGRDWLLSRADALGLQIEAGTVLAESYRAEALGKPAAAGRRATLACMDLRGFGVVKDPERLRQALFDGVGPAKAFGCGLLLVRRA